MISVYSNVFFELFLSFSFLNRLTPYGVSHSACWTRNTTAVIRLYVLAQQSFLPTNQRTPVVSGRNLQQQGRAGPKEDIESDEYSLNSDPLCRNETYRGHAGTLELREYTDLLAKNVFVGRPGVHQERSHFL